MAEVVRPRSGEGAVRTADNAGVTRRSFLKTTALAAGAAVAAESVGFGAIDVSGGVAQTAEAVADEEKQYVNLCRGKCPLVSTIRDGKIVKTRIMEAPDDFRVSQSARGCVKGATTPQRLYATNRILRPMPQTGEPGSDNWEQTSWDEATDLIAQKFQTAQSPSLSMIETS